MSLPPGFLDELRERVSLEAVVGKRVVWDRGKTSRARGDFWAPCPFHQEKTASFHVLERQGFYKCFSCGAKGDAITFLREAEGMSFIEAVKELARMAGMEVPAPSPRAQERQDRRTHLSGILDQAVRHWRMGLSSGAGRAARGYLEGRGLTEEVLARFEIGYAGRDGLLAALTGRGLSEADVIATGCCARPDDGRSPYDFLRDRIVFPIRDGSGRMVSFGGRAMAADAKAKYLNGPQTDLFDKGRTLYNLKDARAAKGPVILAEGYMDVIALVRAGFEGAVAPLGTAVTEDQLALLWRMSDAPVVALDGDAAGLRSAQRLIDLALPRLEPGRTLRFVLLPRGKDPDDLLREGGPEGVAAAFAKPLPLVEMLWRREAEGVDFADPDATGRLDAWINGLSDVIRVRELAHAYRDRLRSLLREARFAAQRGRRGPSVIVPPGPARGSMLATEGSGVAEVLRERLILAVLLSAPDLYATHEEALSEIEFHPANARLAAAVRRCAADPAKCRAALGTGPLEDLARDPHVRVTLGRVAEMADLFLAQEIAKLLTERARRDEMEGTAGVIGEVDDDEALIWRLGQAATAAEAARGALSEDRAVSERAANGAMVDRSDREAWGALLAEIGLEGRD